MAEYIKREDALSYLPSYPLDFSPVEVEAFLRGYEQHEEQVEGCPTADVVERASLEETCTLERKKGKWIKEIHPHDKAYHYKCSVCKEWAGLSDTGYNYEFNYCPYCGTDMRGEDDGN